MYCNDCHILFVVYRPNEKYWFNSYNWSNIKKYETQILIYSLTSHFNVFKRNCFWRIKKY